MLCSLFTQSHLTLCDSMDSSRSDSSAHGIAKQEYWSGVPFPTLDDLPNPGIKPMSLECPALEGEALVNLVCIKKDPAERSNQPIFVSGFEYNICMSWYNKKKHLYYLHKKGDIENTSFE